MEKSIFLTGGRIFKEPKTPLKFEAWFVFRGSGGGYSINLSMERLEIMVEHFGYCTPPGLPRPLQQGRYPGKEWKGRFDGDQLIAIRELENDEWFAFEPSEVAFKPPGVRGDTGR